jgi:2-hydroxychromene-2-carboxylate isomerase
MPLIDYYLSLNSPWTYLGHERMLAVAARAEATVVPYLTDFSVVFPATGGLPLPKRSPQRQAYRLQELERWRTHLDMPLNLHPAHWPVDEVPAATMVIAARESGADALGLAGSFMRAVWAEERDIAARDTQIEIAAGLGLDGAALLASAAADDHAATRRRESEQAIERGVFGAPTYVLGEQLFWGQDRIEFLARALGV